MVLPNEKMTQSILEHILKIAVGSDEVVDAYLHILKYTIICTENDNLRTFEANFRQVNELVNNMRG